MVSARDVDVLVVGAGAAGMAAAVAAKREGAERVLLVDRGTAPGGILTQCIHTGFGLQRMGSELTGPEYAAIEYGAVQEAGIEVWWDTTVLSVDRELSVTVLGPAHGYRRLSTGAVVLATGSRERTRGNIVIAGTRPAGVYTAGTAQQLLNLHGVLPGREVVILGSGDIGLIMARRMTQEGAHVNCVLEVMAEPGGLRRNVVQCLDDFGIPLLLSHTVTAVLGRDRVEGVVISEVDPVTRKPIGDPCTIGCDCLLLSVGLIPEREVAVAAGVPLDTRTGGPLVDAELQTRVPGIFTCGNALHIHDLVDHVSAESEVAGKAAAEFARGEKPARSASTIAVTAGAHVASHTPHSVRVEPGGGMDVSFRVDRRIEDARIVVRYGERVLARKRSRILIPSEMARIHVTFPEDDPLGIDPTDPSGIVVEVGV